MYPKNVLIWNGAGGLNLTFFCTSGAQIPLSPESTQAPTSGNASLPARVQENVSDEVATGTCFPFEEVAYAFQEPSPQIMDGSGKLTPIKGPERLRPLRSVVTDLVMLLRLSVGITSRTLLSVGSAAVKLRTSVIIKLFMLAIKYETEISDLLPLSGEMRRELYSHSI